MSKNISTIITLENFLRNKEYSITYGIKDTHKLIINRRYIVPEYQREIRWEPKNAELLIDDLLSESKFIGTILLSSHVEEMYEIIDGQQRLTVMFMLIHSLKKAYGKPTTALNVCEFKNGSFPYLYEIIDNNFDEDLWNKNTGASITWDNFLSSDVLEQYFQFKKLWKAINDKIIKLTPQKRNTLQKNILSSEVNLIMNIQKPDEPSRNICVKYYLDINDKAINLDPIDIFKGHLFKIDYDNMPNRWALLQKKVKNLSKLNINYTSMILLEHYMACTINDCLNYKIKNFKSDFKLQASITVDSDKYKKGMHLLEVVQTPEYAKEILDNLDGYLEFLENVIKMGSTPNEYFKKLFSVSKGEKVDSVTIDNAFSIISSVIRNDDAVPKILLMKYYFSILTNKKCTKKDYNIIYYIYVATIMFTICELKKSVDDFKKIVLKEQWKEELIDKAINYLDNGGIKKGIYNRKVSQNGIYTKTSGQYLPKDIAAIYGYFNINPDQKSIKIKKPDLQAYFSDKTLSAEHFFINQNYKYEFTYGAEKKNININCPDAIKEFISYTGNFLIIDRTINGNMNNSTVQEKIELLKKNIVNHKSLGSKLADEQFKIIEKIFINFPDLSKIDNEVEAKNVVNDYYINEFPKQYKKYVDTLRTWKIPDELNIKTTK